MLKIITIRLIQKNAEIAKMTIIKKGISHLKPRGIILIADEFEPHNILFLSDVTAELDAAGQVGMKTIQIVRPGTIPGDQHQVCNSFDQVNPD